MVGYELAGACAFAAAFFDESKDDPANHLAEDERHFIAVRIDQMGQRANSIVWEILGELETVKRGMTWLKAKSVEAIAA